MSAEFDTAIEALSCLLNKNKLKISGIAEETNEKDTYVSVSIISDEVEFNKSIKLIKASYQKILIVSGLKFSSISKLQFYIADKLHFRVQLKFIYV